MGPCYPRCCLTVLFFNYFVMKHVILNSVYFLGKTFTVKCITERGTNSLKVQFLHLFLIV